MARHPIPAGLALAESSYPAGASEEPVPGSGLGLESQLCLGVHVIPIYPNEVGEEWVENEFSLLQYN